MTKSTSMGRSEYVQTFLSVVIRVSVSYFYECVWFKCRWKCIFENFSVYVCMKSLELGSNTQIRDDNVVCEHVGPGSKV